VRYPPFIRMPPPLRLLLSPNPLFAFHLLSFSCVSDYSKKAATVSDSINAVCWLFPSRFFLVHSFPIMKFLRCALTSWTILFFQRAESL